MFALNIGARL